MSSALSNYLASSSEEDWKQKLAADEAAATAILELKKLNIPDELRPYIEEIERFDDKDLNPMDEKVREYLKEHSAHESLLYYKEHYVPLTGKLQQIIAEAVQQTERDLKDTNGTAQRVSLYGALALSAAIFGGTVFGVLKRKVPKPNWPRDRSMEHPKAWQRPRRSKPRHCRRRQPRLRK